MYMYDEKLRIFYSRLLKDINYSFEKMHNFFYVILTYVAETFFVNLKVDDSLSRSRLKL